MRLPTHESVAGVIVMVRRTLQADEITAPTLPGTPQASMSVPHALPKPRRARRTGVFARRFITSDMPPLWRVLGGENHTSHGFNMSSELWQAVIPTILHLIVFVVAFISHRKNLAVATLFKQCSKVEIAVHAVSFSCGVAAVCIVFKNLPGSHGETCTIVQACLCTVRAQISIFYTSSKSHLAPALTWRRFSGLAARPSASLSSVRLIDLKLGSMRVLSSLSPGLPSSVYCYITTVLRRPCFCCSAIL